MVARHVIRQYADFVHRAFAQAGLHELQRGFVALLVVERERRFDLGQLLSYQIVEFTGLVTLQGRAMDGEQLPQVMEMLLQLRQRESIGLKVVRVAGEQIPALRRLDIDDQCQRLVECGLHLQG